MKKWKLVVAGCMLVIGFNTQQAFADENLNSVHWDGQTERFEDSVEEGVLTELDGFDGDGILAEEVVPEFPETILESQKIQPRKIIGADQRLQVTDTTKDPYRKVVLLMIKFPGGYGRGTGVMISADTVLTAGHNIYHPQYGGFAQEITAYPAYNKNIAPYGYSVAKDAITTSGWTTTNQTQYDLGAIKLSNPLGNKTGWFGLTSNFTNPITLTGFHGDHDYTMATQTGNATNVSTDLLYYQLDTTGGASGSGVYNNSNQIVGIHTSAATYENTNWATRINSSKLALVKSWISAKSFKTPVVNYRSHSQDYGWMGWKKNGTVAGVTGRKKRMEAIQINLKDYPGGIKYQTHVQNKGWLPWKTNGATAGTTGKKLRVEAIKISLTGDVSKDYHIEYRAHVQNKGWLPWVRDGKVAGTSGKKLRMEAIQIRLVKK